MSLARKYVYLTTRGIKKDKKKSHKMHIVDMRRNNVYAEEKKFP